MTAAKKTTTRRPRKAVPAEAKQPTDHQPPARAELTEADYKVDTAVILQMLGVEPGTVKAGSVKLTFPGGTPVIEYEVVRAVPARLLGVAVLQGANQAQEGKEEEGDRSG